HDPLWTERPAVPPGKVARHPGRDGARAPARLTLAPPPPKWHGQRWRAPAVANEELGGCPGPDSNRDALRRCPLKTVCLPVSPPGPDRKARAQRAGDQAEHLAPGPSRDTLHAMELWVAFAFGAAVGAFVGVVIGRYRATAAARGVAAASGAAGRTPAPPPVQHVVLDEGSANVLNALNNRLAAIGALAD